MDGFTTGPWFTRIGAKADLTARQREIFNYIVAECERGRFPSIRKIGAEFGHTSPNGTVGHLTALVRKGFLIHDPPHYRVAGVRWVAVDLQPQGEQ